MDINLLATDTELELTGVWKDIGLGAKIKVARDNNPKFVTALRTAMAPYQTELQRANLTDDEADLMLNEIIVDTILLDWENIEDRDENGKIFTVPYSRDNALGLLKKFPEFKAIVMRNAGSVENYRTLHIQEVVDNLKK